MPTNIEIAAASKIMYGSPLAEIKALYVGNNKLWPIEKLLPSGYYIESIKSTPTNEVYPYIDLNYNLEAHTTYTVKVKLKVISGNNSPSGSVLLKMAGDNSDGFTITYNGTYVLYIQMGNSASNLGSADTSIDKLNVTTYTFTPTTNYSSIYLFCSGVSNGEPLNPIEAALYELILEKGGTEVIHLVSCGNYTTSTFGFYDLIGEQFYTSNSSANFIQE